MKITKKLNSEMLDCKIWAERYWCLLGCTDEGCKIWRMVLKQIQKGGKEPAEDLLRRKTKRLTEAGYNIKDSEIVIDESKITGGQHETSNERNNSIAEKRDRSL